MKKPQLLLVHGFRGNHLGLGVTRRILEKEGYECYAPDIPPAYNTQKEKLPELESFTADGYAKWIADYIKEKNLKKPILIGHSMGSIISAATADKYPDLINKKIIFLSPICVTPPKFICSLVPLTTLLPNKLIGYITTKYLIIPKDKNILKSTLKTTYACTKRFTKRRDTKKAAKFSVKYAISDFNFNKDCVFIAGEKDKLNFQKQVKKVAAKFNRKPIFLEKSGHLINYECPEKLANVILENL